MEKRTYSITAYQICLKEREKAPKGCTKDELMDYTSYIEDKRKFVNDFVCYLNSKKYEEKNNYFEVSCNLLTRTELEGVSLDVKYGKNGREFTTIDKDNHKHNYDESTKYVCNYKIYFFIIDDELIMVSFRQSQYGCKTAICSEMCEFILSSNIVLSTKIIANEKYVEEILEKSELESLSFDRLVEIDDGEKTMIKKEVCSSTSLQLKVKQNRALSDEVRSLFKGNTKTNLVSSLAIDQKINPSLIDKNSIKTTIRINGVKRVINFSDFENMMYDIDITDKIVLDENGYPIQETIDKAIFDYVKGITLKETVNE